VNVAQTHCFPEFLKVTQEALAIVGLRLDSQ
jgi:hypothetical protein